MNKQSLTLWVIFSAFFCQTIHTAHFLDDEMDIDLEPTKRSFSPAATSSIMGYSALAASAAGALVYKIANSSFRRSLDAKDSAISDLSAQFKKFQTDYDTKEQTHFDDLSRQIAALSQQMNQAMQGENAFSPILPRSAQNAGRRSSAPINDQAGRNLTGEFNAAASASPAAKGEPSEHKSQSRSQLDDSTDIWLAPGNE